MILYKKVINYFLNFKKEFLSNPPLNNFFN